MRIIKDNILKQLFLQQLPNDAQRILVSTSNLVNVERFADIADKRVKVATADTSSIDAVTSQSADAMSTPATSDMQ